MRAITKRLREPPLTDQEKHDGTVQRLGARSGNMMKVNSLWHDVRMILIREMGVDVEKLPNARKMQPYSRVKDEYLNGNTSAASIAQLVKERSQKRRGAQLSAL